MNEFKQSLKIEQNQENQVQKIDDKISANIAKLLSDMINATEGKEERLQILNRMLNLNNLFSNFDREIEVLRKAERERNEKQRYKSRNFKYDSER